MTTENETYKKASHALELAYLINERMAVIESQMDHIVEISKILNENENKNTKNTSSALSLLESRIEKLEGLRKNAVKNIRGSFEL